MSSRIVPDRLLRELIGGGAALAERLAWLIDIARVLAAAHRVARPEVTLPALEQLGISRSKIRRFVEKPGIDLATLRRR